MKIRFSLTVLCCLLLGASICVAKVTGSETKYPVGMKQLEFSTPDNRRLALTLFYPAIRPDDAKPFHMVFFTHLNFYKDAKPLLGEKRPLVIFSHGYGSNGLYYAWFAEYLASRGYIVATVYHYRANTYESSIMYLGNKIWQRPVDISLDINFLLKDQTFGPLIDANRIGIAGHSQGGFTSLWIGGAKTNPDKFLAFQRFWINNPVVPEYIRKELPLDAQPTLHLQDKRVKAIFAMAPGDIKAFGMDEEGLKQLKIPTYIIVGARDTQTPPKENAEFAAKNIPHAQLEILPGLVDHEIFVNECNQLGKDTFPEACIDAAGVDRTKLHERIGKAAIEFFNKNMLPVENRP